MDDELGWIRVLIFEGQDAGYLMAVSFSLGLFLVLSLKVD